MMSIAWCALAFAGAAGGSAPPYTSTTPWTSGGSDPVYDSGDYFYTYDYYYYYTNTYYYDYYGYYYYTTDYYYYDGDTYYYYDDTYGTDTETRPDPPGTSPGDPPPADTGSDKPPCTCAGTPAEGSAPWLGVALLALRRRRRWSTDRVVRGAHAAELDRCSL